MVARLVVALALMIPACPAQVEIATTVAFTEGPTVDAEGNVYFSEQRGQRIFKLAPDGALTTFREKSNGANGMIFDSEWRLVACEATRDKPRVTRTDLKTGQIEVLAERYEGQPLNSPNDAHDRREGAHLLHGSGQARQLSRLPHRPGRQDHAHSDGARHSDAQRHRDLSR